MFCFDQFTKKRQHSTVNFKLFHNQDITKLSDETPRTMLNWQTVLAYLLLSKLVRLVCCMLWRSFVWVKKKSKVVSKGQCQCESMRLKLLNSITVFFIWKEKVGTCFDSFVWFEFWLVCCMLLRSFVWDYKKESKGVGKGRCQWHNVQHHNCKPTPLHN